MSLGSCRTNSDGWEGRQSPIGAMGTTPGDSPGHPDPLPAPSEITEEPGSTAQVEVLFLAPGSPAHGMGCPDARRISLCRARRCRRRQKRRGSNADHPAGGQPARDLACGRRCGRRRPGQVSPASTPLPTPPDARWARLGRAPRTILYRRRRPNLPLEAGGACLDCAPRISREGRQVLARAERPAHADAAGQSRAYRGVSGACGAGRKGTRWGAGGYRRARGRAGGWGGGRGGEGGRMCGARRGGACRGACAGGGEGDGRSRCCGRGSRAGRAG